MDLRCAPFCVFYSGLFTDLLCYCKIKSTIIVRIECLEVVNIAAKI